MSFSFILIMMQTKRMHHKTELTCIPVWLHFTCLDACALFSLNNCSSLTYLQRCVNNACVHVSSFVILSFSCIICACLPPTYIMCWHGLSCLSTLQLHRPNFASSNILTDVQRFVLRQQLFLLWQWLLLLIWWVNMIYFIIDSNLICVIEVQPQHHILIELFLPAYCELSALYCMMIMMW